MIESPEDGLVAADTPYTPERGDIICLAHSTSYGLIVSARAFNQHGLAVFCPISQGERASLRTYGTIVTLNGSGTEIQGAVLCHQIRTIDWRQPQVQFQEFMPQSSLDEVLARLEAIIMG
jgi:mRNA interferase ChpB